MTFEPETPVRVVDGYSEHNLEYGVYKKDGPLGTAYIQLDTKEEGELTMVLGHTLLQKAQEDSA